MNIFRVGCGYDETVDISFLVGGETSQMDYFWELFLNILGLF